MGVFSQKTAPEAMKREDITNTTAAGLNEDAQEIIKDNLEIMQDIVMQIRDDPDFAKSIYVDCPRLQHLLDEKPDLRPIFEDPYLVRLNFEQVYRDAGGVLPEDEKPKPTVLSRIVNSPLFKVLKVFLFIKKFMNCIMGGGMNMIKGCIGGLCFEEAADMADGGGDHHNPDGPDGDADNADNGNAGNRANREALNKAAEHMEDPEVQEQMRDLLENDPEGLADAIEQDPELKALRDSNPLCAELMSDPETMKILTEPENLRGLADAPDLIAQDFADPDWIAPDDVEMGSGNDNLYSLDEAGDYDDGYDLNDDDFDPEEEEDRAAEDFELGEAEEGQGHAGEDLELGEAEGAAEGNVGEDFELGDAEEGNNNAGKGGGKKGQQKKGQDKKQGGGGGGFLSQVGAGLTDMVAAEFVGFGVSEITGGGDDFPLEEDIPSDQIEGAAHSATAVEGAATQATALADAGELLMSDDVADNLDNLEDGMDEIEDTNDERQESQDNRNSSRARAAGAGAAGGLVVGGVGGNGKSSDEDEEENDDEEKEEPKKKRFGFIGNMASAISTAAKEHVATSLLGDDFGEMLVEKVEEDDEEDDEESSKDGEKDNEKSSKSSEKSRSIRGR